MYSCDYKCFKVLNQDSVLTSVEMPVTQTLSLLRAVQILN